MSVGDDEGIPADVLAVFCELKRIVDETVGSLEASASPAPAHYAVAVSDDAGVTDDGSVHASGGGTARVRVSASGGGAPVVIGGGSAQVRVFGSGGGAAVTPADLNAARAWIAARKTAKVVGGAAVALGTLEALIDLGERILDLTR